MICLENVGIRIGNFHLSGINFSIAKGRYGLLMGKTGCGKTTIMEAVCGLKQVHTGKILLHDRDVTTFSPAQRGIGYVPQDVALFSHMTVREHLAFAPRIRKWSRPAIEERVRELSDLLGLRHLLHRKPYGLSGGEAQRVALGRALSCQPDILCLDEPLSALDEETHAEILALLKKISDATHVTILHITHSLREARILADVIYQLKDGEIKAIENRDTPLPAGT